MDAAWKRADQRTALYRLFNKGGELIYVGITYDPAVRWYQHGRDKSWWPEVVEKSVEWFPNRQLALDQEAEVISSLSPRYNTAEHRPAKVRRSAPSSGKNRGGRPKVGVLTNTAYPRDLIARIDAAATKEGLSRAAWLRKVAEEAVS
ncbi:GIY-YIG nuclease family protein [Streptomyces albogriseolus]